MAYQEDKTLMLDSILKAIRRVFSFLAFMPITDEVEISEKLLIKYRCSYCGHDNIAKSRLRQTCDKTEAAAISPNINIVEENEIRATNAKLDALYWYVKKKKRVMNGSPFRAARTARVDCRCERCGNKEPWAKLNFRIFLPTVLIGAVVLVFFLVLFSLFGRTDGVVALEIGLMIYAACVIVAGIVEGVLLLIRRYQINRLPEESRPHFTFPGQSE